MPRALPIEAVSSLLRDVAAAEVLPRFRNLSDTEIHAKTSAQDVVTLADLEAEKALSARLPDLLPASTVVGEEAAYADATILERLSGDGPVWVIDPVDGTGNFSKGIAAFGMIVALVDKGETVAGWILDPIGDRLAIAERGAGATVNGTPVRIDTAATRMNTLKGCAFGPRGKALRGRVGRLIHIGSAAQVYLDLAEGRLQFAAYSRLMPWDHAAGTLLFAEAGGHLGLLDGQAYAPTVHQGDLLLAPNAAVWADMADLLRGSGMVGALR
ncbi:inositol monophosphatase [Roseospira marina]|uniref:Inositol monophosphatase n=1 Tax=Roseospira marina TaxID=140057 RepID=A0A5M6IG71_9PROT|nr:inositol monophosphatase [Roseospira marina]KAA5607300.1 inositol monophosphatase [Roseospira marina]MBB4312543.1 fructose-1,6-bisphosphatase/inositol monophosphatase family enzyme [Roseospira marina]MBB5085441.1 fructose-1,6-bisphosphatase/inositol monophosphatase family enzyme [Roseospira marina]